MATEKERGSMDAFLEQYGRTIGLLMLTFIIILLFSTPSMILAKRVTVIGTELSYASGYELPVRTKMDLGSTAHLQAFPQQIGAWSGVDYNTAGLKELLGADVMLLRAYYSPPKLYQPFFLLIMQSYHRASFHPPTVCYPALGYTIESEGTEIVTVPNASWVEDPWFSADMRRNETILPLKKLVVVKTAPDSGRITERRVVLYFYVKEQPLSSDAITMVRLEALAPTTGSYEEVLNVSREFMSETIPYMFEVQRTERVLFSSLATGSIADKFALIMLFLAPLVVIFYPELRVVRCRRSRT